MLQYLFLVLFAGLVPVATDNNLIEWDASKKLTWDDFKGRPDASSSNAALTSSGINVEFGFNKSVLTYSIKCRFNKSLSWARIKNDYILAHEQGHFDIAEAHARMLKKELDAYVFNSKTVNKDVNGIYERVMKHHIKVQDDYDNETDHSLNMAKQVEWDKKIDSMLEENSKYANYRQPAN